MGERDRDLTALEWLGPARATRVAAFVYLGAWAAATAYLAAVGGQWVLPVFLLLVLGIAFPALAVLLTRGSEAPPVPVARPEREAAVLLGYLLVYAFVFFGPVYTWLTGVLAEDPAGETARLGFKLLVHLVLPALLLVLAGSRLTGMADAGLGRRGVVATLVVFAVVLFGLQAMISPSLANIGALGLPLPAAVLWVALAWLWVSVEAGLCEEFLFRACLQSRLTAWLASPAMGIALTSIVFALVHGPGLYLRADPGDFGQSTDVFEVIAYTVATLSPISILFGVLWHRTRSLLLVVLIHGAVDALPFTASLYGILG